MTDSARDPIAGAAVRLIHEETAVTRTASSDEEGNFVASLLPPGSYRLEIEMTGYKKHVERISLKVNQEVRIDVALEPGTLAEEITVEAPYRASEKRFSRARHRD